MIPDWNLAEVLPPVRPGAAGHSPDRSPYIAALSQMVQRFATSPERIRILRGLLAYRTELKARGISSGFQWLDGSFMEHKESLLGEAPKDVDVVTFFPLPAAKNEAAFASEIADLFDPDTTKAKYLVDAYPYLLGGQTGAAEVKPMEWPRTSPPKLPGFSRMPFRRWPLGWRRICATWGRSPTRRRTSY